MIIGNPKIRKKMNSVVDNLCFGVYLVVMPFAILVGGIVGAFTKLFK